MKKMIIFSLIAFAGFNTAVAINYKHHIYNYTDKEQVVKINVWDAKDKNITVPANNINNPTVVEMGSKCTRAFEVSNEAGRFRKDFGTMHRCSGKELHIRYANPADHSNKQLSLEIR